MKKKLRTFLVWALLLLAFAAAYMAITTERDLPFMAPSNLEADARARVRQSKTRHPCHL